MVLNQFFQCVAKERRIEMGERLVLLEREKEQEGRDSSVDSQK